MILALRFEFRSSDGLALGLENEGSKLPDKTSEKPGLVQICMDLTILEDSNLHQESRSRARRQ